jgi:hypothetical protein
MDSFWALKPPEELTFELLADVDDGMSDECSVELQIKRDSWGQPKLVGRPFMDRQISYSAQVSETSGALELQAAVADHQFRWVSTEQAGGIYELTGQLLFNTVGERAPEQGTTAFSQQMRLDGQAPEPVSQQWIVNARPFGRSAEAREDATVELEVRTSDLTETALVQLYRDQDNLLPIGETDLLLGNAVRREAADVWYFSLNLKDMIAAQQIGIGENTFFLVFEDRLGSRTNTARPIGPVVLTVVEMTPAEVAAMEEEKIPKYDLNVTVVRKNYLGHEVPLPDAVPSVTGSDGKAVAASVTPLGDGAFRINDLAPGEYVVTAESSFQDTGKTVPVNGSEEVVVKADKGPDPIRLELKPKEDEPADDGGG